MPASGRGRFGPVLLPGGFLAFLGGALSATVAFPLVSHAAVGGMLVLFVGGLPHVHSEREKARTFDWITCNV